MRYTIALVTALLLNASANLAMKFGMRTVAREGGLLKHGLVGGIQTIVTSPVLMAGFILFALNAPLYMYALQKYKVSIAYPVMVGCSFAIIAIIAAFSGLGERLSVVQWIGVVLVFAGVTFVANPELPRILLKGLP